MNSAIILILVLGGYFAAYFVYGKYLQDKILMIDPNMTTPAHEFNDGVDFVPSNRFVLFGHHFASIAGLGPILGPAIAVIWGWLPALLWVFFGSIFLGAVHDFAALGMSLHHKGKSIGEITELIVGKRAKTLFQIIIFFLLALAMGVFVIVITQVFALYPAGILPTLSLIFIATAVGTSVYKFKVKLGISTIIGILAMVGAIFLGINYPLNWFSSSSWMKLLLVYAFIASVLPVWMLLQPRDYLNSFQLYFGLIFISIGVLISHPNISAPAINTTATDLPGIVPFLFITIACGAISGFHNLVSSGTTTRQLNKGSDARFVGYGGMLVEGFLAVLVILATTAALGGAQEWYARYGSWQGMSGLKPQLDAFITGSGYFLSFAGIPASFGITFIAVMVVSFAMTTLDSATRLLRYNVEDFGRTLNINVLTNKYLASFVAVVSIAYFAFMKIGGKPAGLTLWQLFGTTNQNLASIGLITITLYLLKQKKNYFVTLLPFLFMFIFTTYAMVLKLDEFLNSQEVVWSLVAVSFLILAMTIWLFIEGLVGFKKTYKGLLVPKGD